MSEAWIIDHCRTPRGIGKKGKGSLADQHPQHLGFGGIEVAGEVVGAGQFESGAMQGRVVGEQFAQQFSGRVDTLGIECREGVLETGLDRGG